MSLPFTDENETDDKAPDDRITEY